MSSSPSEPGLSAAQKPAVPMLSYANLAKPRFALFSAEAWSPLKVELFRSLYIATSVAQIGTWIREAGGPILMENLTHDWPNSPAMVAKVALFSNLPICLFSVFAGAVADVLDRRRFLIVTQVWMMLFSILLGVLTISGRVTPGLLLLLTFIVASGTAAAGPALQALLPELVPKPDLPLAINLNSVALNVARAVGPALFIVVVAIIPGRTGYGISFFLTALSFIWAIWVLSTWKRPPQRAAIHGEAMWDAIRAGFQYTVNSPANRAILLRVLTFIVPAVVIWTQMPIIAVQLLGALRQHKDEVAAGLYAFVGLGAIVGVIIMPGLQKRYKIDPVVIVCTALFAAGLITLSFIHSMPLAWLVMFFLGINWVIIPTNFNTATQTSVPVWVKGRAISFYLTVLFGSFTISAIIWGQVTTATSIHVSLLASGVSMAALLVLAKWYPLTLNQGQDLAPAFAGAPTRPVLPDIAQGQAPPTTDAAPGTVASSAVDGPVEVSLRYDVQPTRVEEFLDLMRHISVQRRRNGAADWRLEPASPPTAGAVTYHEIIRYRSTSEYKRQPARMTRHDLGFLDKARAFHTGGDQPARAQILTGDAADPYAPVKKWAGAQASNSFDRLFDTIAATFDRFTAMHARERKSRVPTYREIRIKVPE